MNKQPKRQLILSCGLCANFDPLRSVCKYTGMDTNAISTSHAENCKRNGAFVRYLYTIPEASNYFSPGEYIPDNWQQDLSNIPKDSHGFPLVVSTRRGLERALPAHEAVVLETDRDFLRKRVSRVLTFQGQRELIYELGVERAKREASKKGIELLVMEDEVGWPGIEKFIVDYDAREKTPWLSDQAAGEWEY